MGMLTIDKLFICIKCNNSSLWFLLFGNIWNFWRKQYRLLSHAKTKAVMDKKLYYWQRCEIVFRGSFLHKSHYLDHIICHVISPCNFSTFQSKWKTVSFNGRTFDISVLMFVYTYPFPLWIYIIVLKWTWWRGEVGSSYLNTPFSILHSQRIWYKTWGS